jgi:adenine deaminase
MPMVASNAARMAGVGDETGVWRPGMTADVSVLDDLRDWVHSCKQPGRVGCARGKYEISAGGCMTAT